MHILHKCITHSHRDHETPFTKMSATDKSALSRSDCVRRARGAIRARRVARDIYRDPPRAHPVDTTRRARLSRREGGRDFCIGTVSTCALRKFSVFGGLPGKRFRVHPELSATHANTRLEREQASVRQVESRARRR